MYFRCVIATRCRAVTSSARALASVRAAETLDISASAAGVNAEQSLARAKHPINMLLRDGANGFEPNVHKKMCR